MVMQSKLNYDNSVYPNLAYPNTPSHVANTTTLKFELSLAIISPKTD